MEARPYYDERSEFSAVRLRRQRPDDLEGWVEYGLDELERCVLVREYASGRPYKDRVVVYGEGPDEALDFEWVPEWAREPGGEEYKLLARRHATRPRASTRRSRIRASPRAGGPTPSPSRSPSAPAPRLAAGTYQLTIESGGTSIQTQLQVRRWAWNDSCIDNALLDHELDPGVPRQLGHAADNRRHVAADRVLNSGIPGLRERDRDAGRSKRRKIVRWCHRQLIDLIDNSGK
jgi:hypothetical protein